MTNEQAALTTAKIVVDTIQFMADNAGVSFDDTVAAILAGGAALARYNALIETATNYVRAA